MLNVNEIHGARLHNAIMHQHVKDGSRQSRYLHWFTCVRMCWLIGFRRLKEFKLRPSLHAVTVKAEGLRSMKIDALRI